MRLASFCFMQVWILTIGKHILWSTKNSVEVTFDRPISSYDNSPKNKAWDFILQGGLPREVVETLSCLTQGSDFIDELNYTQTHKIVIGLSMNSLEEEIIKHAEDVDAVDALGRTPLI